MLYSLRNFKLSFIYYLIYQLFLGSNITFIQLPGVPLLTVDTAMMFWFVALYYCKYRKKYYNPQAFPFMQPLIILAVVYTISLFFSAAGISRALSQYTLQLCGKVLLPIQIWNIVYESKDQQRLVKLLSIVFVPICIYAFIELQIGSNPLIEFEQTLIQDADRVTNGIYEDNDYRGRRIQSVFEHPIGGGVNFAMFAILIFSILYKYPQICRIKKYQIITAAACLVCVVLSNSRGPILLCIMGMMAFVNLKSNKFKKGLLMALVIGVFILPFFSQYYDTIMSIFSSSVRKNYVGSDEDMRLGQFMSAFMLIKDSLLCGVGFNFYSSSLNAVYLQGLLGLESIWLWAIVQTGILGVLATGYYMICTLYQSLKKYASYSSFWIFAAYWTSASLTSFPGMKMGLFYFVAFLFLQQRNLKHQN